PLLATRDRLDRDRRPVDARRLARPHRTRERPLEGAARDLRTASARRRNRRRARRVRGTARRRARRPDQRARMNPGTAALGRGLDVLCALAEPEAGEGLGVVALAELVGGDKSQLSRSLKTLEERGLVERDPDTLAYRLGWRLFA